jgi:hypothetical protein
MNALWVLFFGITNRGFDSFKQNFDELSIMAPCLRFLKDLLLVSTNVRYRYLAKLINRSS